MLEYPSHVEKLTFCFFYKWVIYFKSCWIKDHSHENIKHWGTKLNIPVLSFPAETI